MIEGAKLVELAERVGQVIDGDFFAFSDSDSPWLITQAIDSTLFTVFTDREELLDSLQARFTNTAELPPDAAPELRGPGRS